LKKLLAYLTAAVLLLFVGTVIGFGMLKFDLPASNLYNNFFEDYVLAYQEMGAFSGGEFVRTGFNDPTGRMEVPCNGTGGNQLTVLVAGQSGAANSGGEAGYTAGEAVVNFNFLDGKCYRAADPLLGATGTSGSIWSRLGDRLVDANAGLRVVLIPVAVGGTSINRWSQGGDLNERLRLALSGAQEAGLVITHVFWEQGQSDARTAPAWSKRRSKKFVMYRESADQAPWYTMRRDVYRTHFESIRETIRGTGLSPTFFVATSSMCSNDGSPEIRAAQEEIIGEKEDVRPGPNYDLIHRSNRALFPDDCHLSREGLEAMAAAWFESLTAAMQE
jgi:hypothetical protein